MNRDKRVAVIGASNKPERYAYKAVMLLKEKGYEVFPVHPRLKDIDGLRVYPSPSEIPFPVDTVTLYVSAELSQMMAEELLHVNPRRMIFNPGAENEVLEARARENGVETVRACTLVMLKTGQF